MLGVQHELFHAIFFWGPSCIQRLRDYGTRRDEGGKRMHGQSRCSLFPRTDSHAGTTSQTTACHSQLIPLPKVCTLYKSAQLVDYDIKHTSDASPKSPMPSSRKQPYREPSTFCRPPQQPPYSIRPPRPL